MYLIFDTETTGLPKNWDAPITDTNNWPRAVQIAWQLHDAMGKMIANENFLIQPENFNIPFQAEAVHGISTQLAQEKGKNLQEVLAAFEEALSKTTFIVGHNVNFDVKVMGCELYRKGFETQLKQLEQLHILDTCSEKTANLCQIKGGKGGKFKLPTLTELYSFLFEEGFEEAHNATADVESTTRCFLELIRKGHFSEKELKRDSEYLKKFQETNKNPIQLQSIKHLNLKKESEKLKNPSKEHTVLDIAKNKLILEGVPFVHLHNYSQFSVLQSTTKIPNLIAKTAAYKMPAVALTDKANLMGAFKFIEAVKNHNEKNKSHLKAIVGCEFNVCENHQNKNKKDNGFQIVFLAKNKKGYKNLAKMSSISYTEGFYYVPRIDKKIIEKYKKDVIVLTGNTYGEIPNKILNTGNKQAEEALLWWQKEFGEDLYIELMNHDLPEEKIVNEKLLEFSKKYHIKTVATNHTFYLEKEDANAHDILLCVKEGEKQSTPKGKKRHERYGLPNEEFYFKSPEAMKKLFVETPEAILNIQEIVAKIESYDLKEEVMLPKFDIPKNFKGENDYLKYLSYEGAKNRYGTIEDALKERLDFELEVIKNTGYPGYFLIVADLIKKARAMGVSVGPGRGSAAGSVVAYCLKITNINPIKYNLLFERFLNPERVSMPDIDIDFDDEGREKVIEYVVEKYGAEKVAQIITYGMMAGKSALKDTARVLDLPLMEANKIAKLVPAYQNNISKLFSLNDKDLKETLKTSEDVENVKELKALSEKQNATSKTIQQAQILEGSLRNAGTHACGVIITPEDITNFVPIATNKGTVVTQFDNSVVENAGLLKMDFLGLSNLSIIKSAIKIIKKRYKIDLNIDEIPLNDEKTYELFQKGMTKGIFQYESDGMQKYLKDLKPTVFEDLVAMNALYRPGPLDYIPKFVARKHGTEKITYDLPEMEEILKDTYGITVYQEQVMLLSQKLAGFSKGQADVLRKAMGKKQIAVLEKMESQFKEGAKKNNHDSEILDKIWKDWKEFAKYAFNKSHSVCYAYIAYQTAFLKANYPAEYMAAVLSNAKDTDKVSEFVIDCKAMNIQVLPPSINESFQDFAVNEKGAIRFGMSKIKGVGSSTVDSLVKIRKEKKFESVFDLLKRVDLAKFNKRVFEGLIYSGALDEFKEMHRAQYFQKDEKGKMFIDLLLKFAQSCKNNTIQNSLFASEEMQITPPKIPDCKEYTLSENLLKEKEVMGRYLSANPLDKFNSEINAFAKNEIDFKNLEKRIGETFKLGGIIRNASHRISQKGNEYGSFTLENHIGKNYDFRLFGKNYETFKDLLEDEKCVYLKGIIKEGWFNKYENKKGAPRIEITEMFLLENFFEKKSKGIQIEVKLKNLEENLLENLKTLFSNAKGNQELIFLIHDSEEEKEDLKNLKLKSQNTQIKIEKNLLEALKKIENLNFRVY